MKAEFLEDIGKYITRLDSGKYLIDENITVIDRYRTEISIDDIFSVQRITETPIATHYENADGATKTVIDYEKELGGLRSKSKYDEYSDSNVFNDLDDEYAYKKFLRAWTVCKRIVTQYSDPIQFEIVKSKYDTGCDYVTPILGTENQYGLFTYKRDSFVSWTVNDIFKSLGMRLEHGVQYGATHKDKIWGNSSHSGCQYVVAFGKYPLSSEFRDRPDQKGKLEDCMAWMNKDKGELNRILRSGYASHFMDNVDFGAKDMLVALKEIKAQLSKVKSMAKTSGNYRKAKQAVDNAFKAIQTKLSEATE